MSSDTVHVFDVRVQGKEGPVHFDVMTTDEATALKLAKRHLELVGERGAPLTVEACRFCHSEPLVMFSAEQQRLFTEEGGFIVRVPG